MKEYNIYLGSENSRFWGKFFAKSDADLLKQVKASIENLNPINSSEEGAEAYRNRFRGLKVLNKISKDNFIEIK